jgi:hypothetical protein
LDKPRFAGLRWPGSTRVVVLGQGLAIIILAIRIWRSRVRQSSTLRFSLGFVVVKSHRTKPDGHCRKIAISLIDPEGDPHSFHGFSQFQRRYATSLGKRESEPMREHTHLPAMVGFVR